MTVHIQGKEPGEFVARPLVRTIGRDSGVLAADAAGLGDGSLLAMGEDKLLHEWESGDELIGILLEPDKAEINSGRRRVTYIARLVTVIWERLLVPEGDEAEVQAKLDALNILWRRSDLPTPAWDGTSDL